MNTTNSMDSNFVLDERDFDAIEDQLKKSIYSLYSHVAIEIGVMCAMYHEFADGTGEYAEAFHPWDEFIEAEDWLRNEFGVEEIMTLDDALTLWDYVRWHHEYTFFTIKDTFGFRENFTGDSWTVDPGVFLEDVDNWVATAHDKLGV